MPPGSSSDAAAAAPDRNIGRRVKVYWEQDTTWYSGRVVSHTLRRGWRVEYDTVEGEDDLAAWHDLTEERHEWLEDGGTSGATPASSSAADKKRARAEPSKAAPSRAAHERKAPSKVPSKAVVVKDEHAEEEDEDLVEEVAPPSKGAVAALVLKGANAIHIRIIHADSVVETRHHLVTGDPTMPKALTESRLPEDWEVTFIMTHVNQQLHLSHGAPGRKLVLQWLNGAIRALHEHKTSEDVETAQEISPWRRRHHPGGITQDASTRDVALREGMMQTRRKLREDPTALTHWPLTSEEALQQARAEGLALLVSAENMTGYQGVYQARGVQGKRHFPYMTTGVSGNNASFATAEEAALRLAQAAARRVARLAVLMGEEPGEDEALASGATLKEEVVPPMPQGAFVKEEDILVPPMPPDAVHVKHEVLEGVRPDGGRPKKQRIT